MNKAVTFIIPTFEAKDLLAKNLGAVIAELRRGDELLIIEDAGHDDTARYLEKEVRSRVTNKGASFKLVVNRENLRFGASCNKAVRLAKNSLIFLLNNDVAPHRGCRDALIAHFSDNNVFAVGALERETSGEIHGKNKLWFERGLFYHSKALPMISGETAWVIGGSGMFDRKKWLEIGGFDERYYPAYWEDIDLSFQARKKGWQVLFEEKAVVDHNHESTNLDVFGQEKLVNISLTNANKFTLKNGTLSQKLAFFLWQPYYFYKRYLG